MRRMTSLTFARLSETMESRDMARVCAEAERARACEEITAKALQRILEIARTEGCRDTECMKRIVRIADVALLEIK